MGLDMYLYGVKYLSKYDRDENGNKIRDKTKIIKTEELYWRKANQIHRWFVENVQNGEDDCKAYEVSENKLKELLEECKKIKEDKENAKNILPTQAEFFFGHTEYDKYYYEDIRYTLIKLRNLLDNNDYDWFEYRASW